ncbi:hypothetical protein BDN70DRAFT_766056, partial [Pholiota conissans]
AVCTLRNSVLLRAILGAMAASDTTTIREFDKCSRHIFPCIVVLNSLDFRIQLVLSISFEHPECVK